MQNKEILKTDEFEQLQKEYACLKADFDKQKILNEQLVDKIFKKNVKVLDTNKKTSVFICVVAIMFVLLVAVINGVDMKYAILPALLCLVIMVGYLILYHKLGRVEYGQDSILEMLIKMRKFKKNYMLLNGVLWLLSIGLMAFLIPVIYGSFTISLYGIIAIAFVCVIFIICIVIQYLIDKKVLKACDDIIDRLNYESE